MRIAGIIFLLQSLLFGQFTTFHPELNWLTLKGEKFDVHYHEGAERTANVVKKIMNDVWGPITSLYNYEPEKVHFVIKDIDDYSNGATYFFDNKIEIWTSALDFDLRGSHNWLRNVISHEFTHLVQIQASLKISRSVPAVYLQWLNYEDERRPDILYGFPNVIVSYPLASLNIPAWFAEGTAQYMRKEFNYDNWDTHRDMILRSYVLDDKMLSWNQLGVFEKTSLGNESVYNSGFALVKYISQKYGEDKLRLISEKLGKLTNFTIDAAIKDVLGISGIELYNEWKTFLKSEYLYRTSGVRQNLVKGKIIESDGFGNFYPFFSSDGSKIYYISNQGKDYLSQTSLFEYDLNSKKKKLITSGTRSTVDWLIPDKKIVYSKLGDDNPNSYNVHDLFTFDLISEKEERLTYNMRANNPSVSPDGSQIAFVFQKDGTTNLGTIDSQGKNFRQLTFFTDGEQVYNPKFSPDGTKIIFDFTYHHGRDIAMVSAEGSKLSFLLNKEYDERNAVFDANGDIIYSSDESGIFNLYKYSFRENTSKRITNVLGGAFMPAVSSGGKIAYAEYTSDGYKIAVLDSLFQIDSEFSYIRLENYPLGTDNPKGDIEKFDIQSIKNFNDKNIERVKGDKYRGTFSKLTFFPFIRLDNYSAQNSLINKFKPGVYLTSNDMLNRYSIFAGGATNAKLEYDLFMIFEYKERLPLFFQLGLKPELAVELYNVVRRVDTELLIEEYDPITTDVSYNLFEFDVVAKHRVFSKEDLLEFRYIYSSYTAGIGAFTTNIESLPFSPKFYDTYLIGSNFQLKYDLSLPKIYIDSDINPLGFKSSLKYNYEMNEFNPDGEYKVEDGVLKPSYKNFNFHKVEADLEYGFQVYKKNGLSLRLRGGTIFGPKVPDFFDFYIGGLTGIRGYSFYSLSGNEYFHSQLSLRIPLWREIDAKVGHLYVDKLYLVLSGDAANAWSGPASNFNNVKKAVNAELRMSMTSFYLFPTAVFLSASYGLDGFKRIVRGQEINYGKELRIYGGVLFGFDF